MLTIARDGKARRIAAEWQAPRSAGTAAFASNGMIDDRVQEEIQAEIDHLNTTRGLDRHATPSYYQEALADLRFLAEYLEAEGHRTPVEGWSNIWG